MELKIFKTLWGFEGPYSNAIDQALKAEFNGIEGPAPIESSDKKNFLQRLQENNLDYIAEITTAGSYVPDRHATLNQHIESLKSRLDMSLEYDPLFITCLGGCDAWPEEKNIEFFHAAMEYAKLNQVTISFETHRGRAFFNPWVTQRIVNQIPNIKLTCDFSHWCVVCERLMDTELDVIESLLPNAHHIHARVGYDQGPQVPHPAAPEYENELQSHQRWWQSIWKFQATSEYAISTMTPEFGPDRYLHEQPFSQEPVADLWEVNQWMAKEERNHFTRIFQD